MSYYTLAALVDESFYDHDKIFEGKIAKISGSDPRSFSENVRH